MSFPDPLLAHAYRLKGTLGTPLDLGDVLSRHRRVLALADRMSTVLRSMATPGWPATPPGRSSCGRHGAGSSSSRGGTPPYLGPYFAAKAAEDALAVSYAAELTRFGIETTIIVPGSFTSGTNHFANAGKPADKYIARAYEAEYSGLMDEVSMKLGELAPNDADPSEVARQIVKVVDTPKDSRPFRVYVDPADDGAQDVFRVGDRVRQWFYQRIGILDLLSADSSASRKSTGQ